MTHHLSGKGQCGDSIPPKMHLQRQLTTDKLTNMWLYTWGQEEEM